MTKCYLIGWWNTKASTGQSGCTFLMNIHEPPCKMLIGKVDKSRRQRDYVLEGEKSKDLGLSTFCSSKKAFTGAVAKYYC